MIGGRVTLLGYGRVGRALALALTRAGWRVVNVGEQEESPRVAVALEDGLKVLPASHVDLNADLLVLALPDDRIEAEASRIAGELKERNGGAERVENGRPPVVMHLSGRLGLEPLTSLRELGYTRLAFHPMQSFPPEAGAERFAGISVGVTADPEAEETASQLAESLGVHTLGVKEEERTRYHLASVLASNFMPLLLDLGAQSLEGIAKDRGEAVAALWPLMAGMLENLRTMPPEYAMTGPVVRGDLEAVQKHADTLPPDERSLYLALTRGLLSLAQRSGKMDEAEIKRWLSALAEGNGRQGELG